MKELLLLLIGSVVMNNCVLQGYLGVTAAMGNAKCSCKCAKIGLAVTAAMVLTTLVAWPVQNFVLAPFGLEYFRTLLFVLIILALVYAMKALVKVEGICFPLVALNTAVLGVTLQNISLTFVQALVASLGAGLGLMVAMLLFAGVRSRLEKCNVPKFLQGLPITLIAAAIVALSFLGFAGVA